RTGADLAPEAPFALGNLALTYASLARWRFYEGLPLEGTVSEGRAVLDELRRRNPDSSPAMLVDLELSVLAARRALALGEDPTAPLGRAIAVAETARQSAATFHLYFVMAEAEAHLTWAEHLGPSTPEGAAYLERALGGIHEATTADPTQVRPHVLGGDASRLVGDGEAARRSYRRALDLAPENRAARAGLEALDR
ncbi:MAG: hypothetical protein AAGD06_16115, partial [Acidobacteriota bacterium]